MPRNHEEEKNNDEVAAPQNGREPLPPGVFRVDRTRTKYHNEVLEFFITLFDQLGIPVNYDHIKTNIPKNEKIPLWYKEGNRWHRGDIAWLIRKDRVAIIEIHTRKITELMKTLEHLTNEDIEKNEEENK